MLRLQIEITSIPAGDAPLDIRRCWIGLVLELVEGHGPPPHRIPTHSILIDSGTWRYQIRRLFGLEPKFEEWTGYVVDMAEAVATLEKTRPEAALWWRENAPHLFGRTVLFPADCCRLLINDNDD